jgi:hypothetical protein
LTESAAVVGDLTLEHAPPHSSGGKPIALTCRECNTGAGAALDHEMQHLRNLLGFARAAMPQPVLMHARVGAARVTVSVDTPDGGYQVRGRPRHNHPANQEQFETEMARLGHGERIDLKLSPVKPFRFDRAKLGWLRAAYIVAFAALGYRYAARRELDPVREQFHLPDRQILPRFWAHQPNAASDARQLALVQLSQDTQAIGVQMGEHIVFLPEPGRGDAYGYLASQERGAAFNFKASPIPWPNTLVLARDK